MSSRAVELLAPAGSWDCLRAAVANGADAVYFGLPRFNARLRTDNFSVEDLPKVVDFCHRHGVMAYVTLNTLIFTRELEDVADYLRILSREGVDAILVQDIGLAELARKIVPDLPIHASTQMTITSPEGAKFVSELGIQRVVLARELSLREIKKFHANRSNRSDQTDPTDQKPLELEVFVHGALCVAYSGQCLTSESLGQRSANRGECAQACRLPYELIVDGQKRDLGDKRYLLSPQDLAAVDEIPELLELGVVSFKIEGRLKSPEYVAAVTQVYRKAIDAALQNRPLAAVGDQGHSMPGDPPENQRHSSPEERPFKTYFKIDDQPQTAATGPDKASAQDRYQLEMTFSRGLFSGWLHGVNHQKLVSARFGKKRGPFAGRIERVGRDHVELSPLVELKPGDGIVFDTGGDTDHEQGGRIFEIRPAGRNQRLFFKHGHINFTKVKQWDRVWKTDDPALNAQLKKTYSGTIPATRKEPLDLSVSGKEGMPLVLECGEAKVFSNIPLQAARTAPLTTEKLRDHLGRFGESPFSLGHLENQIEGALILPIGELNRMRRELLFAVKAQRKVARRETETSVEELLGQIGRGKEEGSPTLISATEASPTQPHSSHTSHFPNSSHGEGALTVLCRTLEQIEAALQAGAHTITADFEDVRRYKEAVALVKDRSNRSDQTDRTDPQKPQILLATPRIQKAGEEGFFKLIANTNPHGVLIRNLGALEFFAGSPLRRLGDFSLNVANPFTAEFFIRHGLERVSISYDLKIEEVLALLAKAPPEWFELTLHQHMPMFHMEHCVFAAFLSNGTDHTNCGRPCDSHRVHLRDRVGIEHPLRADVGCRNTLFNATAQTGACYFRELWETGLRNYRVELLEETPAETKKIVDAYLKLLAGRTEGDNLWAKLDATSQLGVTRGTLG